MPPFERSRPPRMRNGLSIICTSIKLLLAWPERRLRLLSASAAMFPAASASERISLMRRAAIDLFPEYNRVHDPAGQQSEHSGDDQCAEEEDQHSPPMGDHVVPPRRMDTQHERPQGEQ